MKNLNLYALANELNLGDSKSCTIRVPFGRWDFGAKKFEDGTLACVEIDQYSEKRKSRILRFKTMWKEKIS